MARREALTARVQPNCPIFACERSYWLKGNQFGLTWATG